MDKSSELIKLAAATVIKQEMRKESGLLMSLLTIPFIMNAVKNMQNQPEEPNGAVGVNWDGHNRTFLQKAWSGLKNAFGGNDIRSLPSSTALGLDGGTRLSASPGPFYGAQLANVLNAVGNAQAGTPSLNMAQAESGGLLSGLTSGLGNLFGG